MYKYKYIKNVSKENFILGGLVYHHKQITDETLRNEEFNNMVQFKINKNYSKKEVGLVELPFLINNIINSNSLNENVMNKILGINYEETVENPIEKIYNNINHDNIFINDGIKIIDSDEIIFISHKGIVGDVYDQGINEQQLMIRYKYDDVLKVNIGEVYDNKLINDFLYYYNYIEELGG